MAEWMPNQLVGQFDVVGVDPRKAKLQHTEATFKAGFSTTGEITHCDSKGAPLVRQQISFTALTEEGIAVVIERAVAVADVEVKSSRALNFALANDIFNGSVRKIGLDMSDQTFGLDGAKNLDSATAAEPTANAASTIARKTASRALTIDNQLGIVSLDEDQLTIHDCSGRNAQWGSLQYDVISGEEMGERNVKAGDAVLDSAYVLSAGDWRSTWTHFWQSFYPSSRDEVGVRYRFVGVTPVRSYLIVANLDGQDRTVSVPLDAGKSQQVELKGFQTRIYHVVTGCLPPHVRMTPVLS